MLYLCFGFSFRFELELVLKLGIEEGLGSRF